MRTRLESFGNQCCHVLTFGTHTGLIVKGLQPSLCAGLAGCVVCLIVWAVCVCLVDCLVHVWVAGVTLAIAIAGNG